VSSPTFSSAPPPSSDSGWNLKVAVLFGAVIALLAANIYLFVQLDRVRSDMAKFRESTLTEIANLREASSVTTATNRKNLETMREELEASRRQGAMAVGQAKVEALKKTEQLTNALAEEQRRQQAQVASQISEVKQATSDATSKIGEVKTDVTSVKSDVAATRAELDKTIADLKRVNGDMGEMSGLIATNGKELSALKQLGDRNYFEFNLKKTKGPQKIGDVAVLLKKTDPKKNRYTLDVIADDKRVEKKDRNINEPVQFYVAKARQPYELVVNEVRKDQIVGYLATPKVQQSR
jgi:chromosome segregation ATPase